MFKIFLFSKVLVHFLCPFFLFVEFFILVYSGYLTIVGYKSCKCLLQCVACLLTLIIIHFIMWAFPVVRYKVVKSFNNRFTEA